MRKTCLALLVPLALGIVSPSLIQPASARVVFPGVSLAERYHHSLDPTRYLVSEKLDGARAYWDGQRLLSRTGNEFQAPDWFTADFPPEPLDGELWIGRGRFQELMSVIRDTVPDPLAWRAVHYHVFDLPDALGDAESRQRQLAALLDSQRQSAIRLVPQTRVSSRVGLDRELERIVAAGGEGVMLQLRDAPYQTGRHGGLLKLTPHEDAEATVIGYTDGRGKHTGRVGALIVEDATGQLFKLGTGLSDADRATPPAVGSRVTYRFSGRTERGLPRFARFLRERPAD